MLGAAQRGVEPPAWVKAATFAGVQEGREGANLLRHQVSK